MNYYRNNTNVRSHILSTASIQKALGNSNSGTNKKKDSKRRTSRKSDSTVNSKNDQPTSQWYTTTDSNISFQSTPDTMSLNSSYISASTTSLPSTPVFELRQDVSNIF